MTAAANTPGALPGVSAIQLLGRKLDSIPFSAYHIGLIVVLGLVGFVEGYDLALGGSLIVLAKGAAASAGDRHPMARLRRRRCWSSRRLSPPRRCPTG